MDGDGDEGTDAGTDGTGERDGARLVFLPAATYLTTSTNIAAAAATNTTAAAAAAFVTAGRKTPRMAKDKGKDKIPKSEDSIKEESQSGERHGAGHG